MLTDGIGQVTISNGVLRIQLLKIDPGGEAAPSGTLEIPKDSVQGFMNGLVESINQINEKILEASDDKSNDKEDSGKKKTDKKKNN